MNYRKTGSDARELQKTKTITHTQDINPKIVKFFEALANENRLKILLKISQGPITVSELHRSLDGSMTLSGLSHQLKSLSNLDIVILEKSGREKYCRLSESFCWCILEDAFRHFDPKTRCSGCCKSTR